MEEYQVADPHTIQAIFHAIDWFGTPVSRQITFKGKRRLTTVTGGLCSFVMAFFVFWWAILCCKAAVENNHPNYTATSLQNSFTGQSEPIMINFDEMIIAFKPSLGVEYMLGIFYAVETADGVSNTTAFGTNLCSGIYNDKEKAPNTYNPAIWALIDDPDYWCLDAASSDTEYKGFSPSQQGFDTKFSLEINTCVNAMYDYSQLFNHKIWPFPRPTDGICKDPFTDQGNNIDVEVKVISQIFDYENYNDATSESVLSYYLDSYQKQSFINENTTSTVTINLQRNELYLGQSSVYNTADEGVF